MADLKSYLSSLFARGYDTNSGGEDAPVQPDATRELNDPVGSVARACVSRIISRAANVRFKGKEGSRPNAPCGRTGAREFYSQLLTQLLYQGAALAYRAEDGHFRVAITEGSELVLRHDRFGNPDDQWHLLTDKTTTGKMRVVPARDVLFVTRRPQEGDRPYLPDPPLKEIRDATGLYEAARRHQHDYSDRGSRIGYVLHGNKEVTNRKKMANTLAKIKNILSGPKRNYQVVVVPLEMDAKPMPSPAAPASGSIEYATQEVARHFGVPLQMLQTDAASTADEERVESRLLTDAVFPLLDRISVAWEELLGEQVKYDSMSVSLATLGARVAHIKHLAQVRALTVNEIRALIDYEPLTDGRGDELSSPAGGPDDDKKNGRPKKGEEKED